MKKGYCITTKKFTLQCKHPEWFAVTQEYYNQIVFFYYQLLLEHREFHTLSNQQILRNLEKRTISGREKQPVENPLPWKKVPLYFRRAAINTAIGLVKSYQNREDFCNPAASTHASVVYYKGMYRDFQQNKVSLKVWNGETWNWIQCRLSGNQFLPSMERLSPTIVLTKKRVFLHIPVKEEIEDIRTAKERMLKGENLCSIQFTNSDAFVVACVLNADGQQKAVRFWKGGKKYQHDCQQILKRIQKSEVSRKGFSPEEEKENQIYWMRLKQISYAYAHQISSEMVTFCLEQEAKLIVVPMKNGIYSKAVYQSVGNWSPLHLSFRIREFLTYKAWKAGIVLVEKAPEKALEQCPICGEKIEKRKELYQCKNGHRGNRYLEAARSLGRSCQKDFQKKQKIGKREKNETQK